MESLNPAFIHRATIWFVEDDKDEEQVDTFYDWEEKWKKHFHTVGGCFNNEVYEQHILCTKEALDSLPDEINDTDSDWVLGKITEAEIRKEMGEE